MKIVKFLGGLGNQMFQYAFYKALQKKFPDVKADLHGYAAYSLHNGFELEEVFGIKLPQVSAFTSKLFYKKEWIYRKLRRILNLRNAYTEEKQLFAFDPSMLNNTKTAYYWGYWQNFQYFDEIAAEIRTDFSFKHRLSKENQDVLNQISQHNSVSIHIRRGDYLNDSLLGGVFSLAYYQQAIDYITANVTHPVFYLFSDDISWCKDNLKVTNCSYISWNTGSSSYIDMQLMSACKHNIIANSSFSWWAAWLNPHEEKIVICPKKWVNDNHRDLHLSFPENWISF